MTDELIPSTINEDQARAVGLPSPAALQYMMGVANMLLTSNLLGPDLEPSKEAIESLQRLKWEQSAIDEYRDKVIRSNALAKMLIGQEMGMSPIGSLQDVSIVKGRMFIHYSALIRQMQMKGYTCTWVERTNEKAALKVAKDGDEQLFTFTIEDAKLAGLLNSPPGKEQFNQYRLRPRVMLTARVASEAYRTTGGRANVYTPEEKSEVLDSTMGEPSPEDEKRLAVIQEKYHVGLKTDKQPDTAPPVQETKQDARPETKPNGKAKESSKEAAKEAPKEPIKDNVVEMPTTAAQEQPEPRYVIYTRDNGTYILAPSERPQSDLAVNKMRAQAMANQTGNAHYVLTEAMGAHSTPVFTAQPPEKPAASTEPKPAPAAAAETKGDTKQASPLKKRLIALAASVTETVNHGLAPDKMIPGKTVAAKVSTFFVGYFGIAKVSDLPTPEDHVDEYTNAFADLESCAAQDATALLNAPEDTGKRMAANTRRLKGMLQGELKWPVQNVDYGMALARLRSFDFQDMLTFLENAQLIKRSNGGQFESALSQDIGAALRLCLKTRQAGKFLRECTSRNLSIAETLRWMEERQFSSETLESRTEADVIKAIEWATQAIADRAKMEEAKAANPTPPPSAPRRRAQETAPAPQAEEDGDNLFADMP